MRGGELFQSARMIIAKTVENRINVYESKLLHPAGYWREGNIANFDGEKTHNEVSEVVKVIEA